MGKHRSIIITVSILVIVLMSVIVSFEFNQRGSDHTLIYLNDQWSYFRNLSMDQNDLTDDRMKQAETISLPEYFKKSLFTDLYEHAERGTLYKKISINEKYIGKTLGLRVPYFPRGSRIMVNGRVLEGNEKNKLTPNTLYFTVDQKDLDLLIQFEYSNTDFWAGEGVLIGLAGDVEKDVQKKDVLNLALVVSILILLIYHSFFYVKNDIKSNFWSILIFSAVIVFKAVTFSQNTMVTMFSNIPLALYNKLIYISLYIYFPSIILMINTLQPNRINKRVVDTSVYYLIFNVIIVLVAPFNIISLLIYPSIVYVCFVVYDMVISLNKAYKKSKNKMIFMVLMFLLILIAIYIYELMFFSNIILYKYHLLIGVVLFIILEASYMFYTYNEAFVEITALEELNEDMKIRFNAFNRDYQELLNQQFGDEGLNFVHKKLQDDLALFLEGLDHIYFYVDKDLKLSQFYSKNAALVFTDIREGELVTSLLFPNNIDDKLYFETVAGKLFNSNNVNEIPLFLNLMPKEIFIKDRYYDTSFQVLNRGESKFIYIKLVDQSQKTTLLNINNDEVEALRMSVSVMSNIEDFYFYVEEYDKFCTVDIFRIMSQKTPLKQTIYDLLRHIHTYKTIFARFNMQMTVKLLHSIETEILEILEDVDQLTFVEFKEIMLGYDLLSFLEKDLTTIEGVSGIDILNEKRVVRVEKDKIDGVIHSIHQLNKTHNLNDLLLEVKKLKYIKLNKMFAANKKYIYTLADRKETLIESVEIDMAPVEIDGRRFGSFMKSLNQVFSNIIEHGIESPTEREALGKTRGGNISIKGVVTGSKLHLSIEDDGRGIDVNRMKDKLFKENKMTFDELLNASEEAILAKIFEEGFSSKDQVDEVSGRGLGLYDVKRELLALNGDLKVSTTLNQYTRFEFTLPIGE